MSIMHRRERIEMPHGGGGRMTSALIRDVFHRHFANPLLDQGHDATVMERPAGRIVMTTDAHIVSPLFFPGGDIGSLSVHGTLNDVAMAGAVPTALSAAFIIEEGFPLSDLTRIAASMGDAARAAGVPIVTGDTKVVEKGKGDGLFITTAGIGVVPDGVDIGTHRVRPGQQIILSGTIGDHGVAILAHRQNLSFETSIVSDSQALHHLVAQIVATAPTIAMLRDPTRGGLSATLNEIASDAGVGIHIDECKVPVKPEVASACELLGLDPVHIANEGKLVAICDPQDADAVLSVMRARPEGADAAIIGEVRADTAGLVEMQTAIGGRRVIDWLSGEQLPRIC
ncbi:MAG: hydrogenase expression/formation protein HypE [Sphingobium sp.]|nr:hydrogenase expression/formation protein HypE [Sphingobium sp.]